MRDVRLENYKNQLILDKDNPVLSEIRPFIFDLIEQLLSLHLNSPVRNVLLAFEKCIKRINQFDDNIGTEEREAILAVIYDIGTIVGLDPDSKFAEKWRGDW